MAVVYLVVLIGCSLRAVVHVPDIRQLELVSHRVLVGIGEVVACHLLHTHRLVHGGKIKRVMVLSVHQLGNRCAVKDSVLLPLLVFLYRLSFYKA